MATGPLEKDTCRDYVLPRLQAAGWTDEQIQIEFPITDGRIISVGSKHRRGDALRADYVLEYRPGLPIAVVEAKREHAIPGKGLQQGKNYAQLLDVPFTYATNGKGIVEDDRGTGRETENLDAFPGPEDLWARFRGFKGLDDELSSAGVALPFNRSLRNFDGSAKEPRYYQRTAINRSVAAVLRGDKRVLLTLATGTRQDVRVDADRLEALEQRMARRPSAANPLPRRPQHPDRPAAARLLCARIRRGPDLDASGRPEVRA